MRFIYVIQVLRGETSFLLCVVFLSFSRTLLHALSLAPLVSGAHVIAQMYANHLRFGHISIDETEPGERPTKLNAFIDRLS